MIRHVRMPRYDMGAEATIGVIDTWVNTGDGSGRCVMAMVDGPGHLLLALDDARPGKCPRCGHDEPGDPSRRPDGDHLVNVTGPVDFERIGQVDGENYVRYRATEPFLMVWCSRLDETLAEIRATVP